MQGLTIKAAKAWLGRTLVFGLALLLLLTFLTPVKTSADTIVHGFKTKGTIQPGWVAALDKTASDTVEASPGNDASRIYGVVIDPSQAPVTVSLQNQQVFVATSGTYPVLVSSQAGGVKPGDYISISSITGIAAKANSRQSNILGRAVESFDGKNNVLTSGSDGSSIGRIEVTIGPGKNPLVKSDASVPGPLKHVGQAIAGKSVSAIRIYAALAIFFVVSVIAGAILWAGVRSGMIALGRNPLSKQSIMGGLVQVIMVAILVFIVGLAGVYLLLRL